MSTRFRIILTLFVIVISLLLVWPNVGERSVIVEFKARATADEIAETSKKLEEFLEANYKGRYTWERKEKTVKEEKKEVNIENPDFISGGSEYKTTYYEIRGRFIQDAFLNELGRIEGIIQDRVYREPLWVEENLKAKPFKLGLDLQGGMNLVLEGDFEKLERDLKERYEQKDTTGKNWFDKKQEELNKEKDPDKKEGIQAEIDQVRELLQLDEEKQRQYIQSAKNIIRKRIETGISEPVIRVQGNDKLEISLPGVSSPERAKKLIAQTAKVTYHLAETGGYQGKYTTLANQSFAEYNKIKAPEDRRQYIKELEKKISLPPELGIYVDWGKENKKDDKSVPLRFLVLERDPALGGKDIAPNAFGQRSPETGKWIVNFSLTSEGSTRFGKLTSENRGRLMAIVIDNRIQSAPQINEPIFSTSAQITGNFTPAEAEDLALVIKEGSLPIDLNIVEERSIGPSLGQEAIDKGVTAILYGLIAVIVFMMVYYHVGGLIANLALVLNLLLMSALLAWMDFTITLPGLAGVVLTLGMAVDANVIIYERIREELGRGKSLKLAVQQGFERATLTILDANFTTLVAAVVLSKFGVGPIKGFAITLFLGILTSLFTALFVSRTIFYLIVYEFNLKALPLGWGRYLSKRKQALGSGREIEEPASS